MANIKKISGPLRVAVYGRVSSDEQADAEFGSTEAQEAACRRFLDQNGYIFAGFYSDEARTGTSLKRPGFKRMLTDAQEKRFDAVAITFMSRLGRGKAFTIAEYELQQVRVQVLTVKETFADDFNGQMAKGVKIFTEGLYPQFISQATKAKQEEMVRKGYHTGGVVPFGYVSVIAEDGLRFRGEGKNPPKRLIADPVNAPLVAKAYALFLETSSFTRVQDYLNAVTERQWGLNTTISLLQRETYTGVLLFGQWRNEQAFPPVVDRQTWEAVQSLIASRPRAPRKDREKETVAFYLRGLVHCGCCGGRLTPAGHHGSKSFVKYYECLSNTRRLKPCSVKRVNADSLHQVVLEEIRRGADHPTRTAELIREAVKQVPTAEKSDDQLTAIARRLRDTDKRIKNLMSVMEAGGAGVRSLISRLQELEEDRARLLEEQRRLEAEKAETRLDRPDAGQVQALWGRFLQLWEKATDEERTKLMPLIVERVVMTEKERGICDLLFSADTAPSRNALTSKDVLVNSMNRAGVGLEPTTFGL